jgi:GNAT superfamily N-acetyltransferase
VAHPLARGGTAGDRSAVADPFRFREGRGRGLDEASDEAVQRLVTACRDDLLLASGGERDEAIATLLRPLPGAALERRLALGVFDRAEELRAAVDGSRGLPQEGSWLVGFILVRPDLRGRGLATGLLARVERLARAADASRLEVVAPAWNRALLQCLRRAGFSPQREVDLASGGATVRAFHLARELTAVEAVGPGASA